MQRPYQEVLDEALRRLKYLDEEKYEIYAQRMIAEDKDLYVNNSEMEEVELHEVNYQ